MIAGQADSQDSNPIGSEPTLQACKWPSWLLELTLSFSLPQTRAVCCAVSDTWRRSRANSEEAWSQLLWLHFCYGYVSGFEVGSALQIYGAQRHVMWLS